MEKKLKREFLVKPSESNANRELPLTLLAAQLIDIATDHANELGIGFIKLEPKGLGWVLSRMSIEMSRWPKTGESYFISTWVENWNGHFSQRCFSVEDASGKLIGYARTVWVIIDLVSHESVGTAGLTLPDGFVTGEGCPIDKFYRHRSFNPDSVVDYKFKYTDLDFYRHVNTVRYISLLLNQFTLEEFDTHLLSRFDIAFHHEAKYGDTVQIKSIEEPTETPFLLRSSNLAASKARTFELSVGSLPILKANITITPLLDSAL